MAADPIRLHEFTVVKADLLRFEFRDESIVDPHLQQLEVADAGAMGATVTRTHPLTGASASAIVIGVERKNLYFGSRLPRNYVDRDALDVAGNWSTIGGRTVTAVYRKTEPYDWGGGFDTPTGLSGNWAGMKHYTYVQLDDDLPEGGPYTVTPPVASGVPAFSIDYDSYDTRCSALAVQAWGHAPDDADMMGYLAQWVPGMGSEAGALSFSEFSTAQLINAVGGVVYEIPITQRIAPTTSEDTYQHTNQIRYAVHGSQKTITAITNANPGRVTIANHGYTTGTIKKLRAIAGMSGLHGDFVTITIDGTNPTNTFTIDQNTTSAGTFTTGTYLSKYENLCYDTTLANRANTYVYGLDYTGVDQAMLVPGYYRIRLPGVGVSDAFYIDPCMWWELAEISAGGEYNQRHGQALLDAKYGYEKPISLIDSDAGAGADRRGYGRQVYWSYMPAAINRELSTATDNLVGAFGTIVTGFVGVPEWATAWRATNFAAPWQDAGDWDSFPTAHTPCMALALQYAHDALPEAARNIQFPKHPVNTEIPNATIYAGTDGLPSIVQMVTYYHEPFRRHQDDGTLFPCGGIGGGCPSGTAFSTGSLTVPGTNAAGSTGEVVDLLSSKEMYICAPDPVSNFWQAGIGAMLARIYYDYGFTTVGDAWRDYAIAAADWAEEFYTDSASRTTYLQTTLSMGTRPFYVAVAITSANTGTDVVTVSSTDVGGGNTSLGVTGDKYKTLNGSGTLPVGVGITNGGFVYIRILTTTTCTFHPTEADANANTNIINITSTGTGTITRHMSAASLTAFASNLITACVGPRDFAAGALFRLLGAADPDGAYWKTVIEASGGGAFPDMGIWEYINADADNPLRSSFLLSAGGPLPNIVDDYLDYVEGTIGFRNNGTEGAPYMGPAPQLLLLKGHILTRDSVYLQEDTDMAERMLRALMSGDRFGKGCNQEDGSFTSYEGFPRDFSTSVLHKGYKEYGYKRSPDGITKYAYDALNWAWTQQDGFEVAVGGAQNHRTIDTPLVNTGAYATDFIGARTIDPWWHCFPKNEQSFETVGLIYVAEFTTEQAIYPELITEMYCHAWNGNTSTTRGTAKVRTRLKLAA
jgi:hypothetical protein